jgi:hypothetical protein
MTFVANLAGANESPPNNSQTTGIENGLSNFNIHHCEFRGGEIIRGQLSAVPGPIAGAGLLVYPFANGGLVGWWRRPAGEPWNAAQPRGLSAGFVAARPEQGKPRG